jgi:hypothetical protein
MLFTGMLLMSERAEQTAQDVLTSITSTPL